MGLPLGDWPGDCRDGPRDDRDRLDDWLSGRSGGGRTTGGAASEATIAGESRNSTGLRAV